MVVSISNTQPGQTPEVSQAPRILVVDDVYFKAVGIANALTQAGYAVEMSAHVEDAAQKLRTSKFDFAVIDGDLGDSRWDETSRSARLITEHLGSIPYGRYTGKPELIPQSLRGRFCYDEVPNVAAWIFENLPIQPELPSTMPRVTAEPHSLELMVGEEPSEPGANRTFPDVGALDPSSGTSEQQLK